MYWMIQVLTSFYQISDFVRMHFSLNQSFYKIMCSFIDCDCGTFVLCLWFHHFYFISSRLWLLSLCDCSLQALSPVGDCSFSQICFLYTFLQTLCFVLFLFSSSSRNQCWRSFQQNFKSKRYLLVVNYVICFCPLL